MGKFQNWIRRWCRHYTIHHWNVIDAVPNHAICVHLNYIYACMQTNIMPFQSGITQFFTFTEFNVTFLSLISICIHMNTINYDVHNRKEPFEITFLRLFENSSCDTSAVRWLNWKACETYVTWHFISYCFTWDNIVRYWNKIQKLKATIDIILCNG